MHSFAYMWMCTSLWLFVCNSIISGRCMCLFTRVCGMFVQSQGSGQVHCWNNNYEQLLKIVLDPIQSTMTEFMTLPFMYFLLVVLYCTGCLV